MLLKILSSLQIITKIYESQNVSQEDQYEILRVVKQSFSIQTNDAIALNQVNADLMNRFRQYYRIQLYANPTYPRTYETFIVIQVIITYPPKYVYIYLP